MWFEKVKRKIAGDGYVVTLREHVDGPRRKAGVRRVGPEANKGKSPQILIILDMADGYFNENSFGRLSVVRDYSEFLGIGRDCQEGVDFVARVPALKAAITLHVLQQKS